MSENDANSASKLQQKLLACVNCNNILPPVCYNNTLYHGKVGIRLSDNVFKSH